METGEIIKHMRKSRKLSQFELSLRSGIDTAQIGRYERGEKQPSLPSLRKLADGFRVECSELIDDEPRSFKMGRIKAEGKRFCKKLIGVVGEPHYLTREFKQFMKLTEKNFR